MTPSPSEAQLKELADDLAHVREIIGAHCSVPDCRACALNRDSLDLAIRLAEAVGKNVVGFLNWAKIVGAEI